MAGNPAVEVEIKIMASFNRADYERVAEIARQFHLYPPVPLTKRKQLARELFEMVEGVIGQQSPPLDPKRSHYPGLAR